MGIGGRGKVMDSPAKNVSIVTLNPGNVKRGWCYSCGQTMWTPASGEYVCDRCGRSLTGRKLLPQRLKQVFDFQSWDDDVSLRGLGGPSPSGAATELRCHRTTIDKLAQMGVLERSVYDKDGFYVVYISDRSIQKALANKAKTGKWTDSGEKRKGQLWKLLRKGLRIAGDKN